MKAKYQSRRAQLSAAALVVLLSLAGSSSTRAASGPVTMTVTAVSKNSTPPPPIKKEDVNVFEGKEKVQVADWKQGGDLLLGILIDDSLDADAAGQWSDLKAFINAQPPTTRVAVAYGRNGAAMIAQDFTDNHELAAKALRIPLGDSGAFSSPYLVVQDWLKRWPDVKGVRSSIVLISSGIDYFRGSFDPIDPDLDTTVSRAQKQNVNLWTIYYPDAGHVGRRYFRVFNAQSNLSRLSEETGAESYYLEFGKPVSLKPYFDELNEHLNNQYLLAFLPSGGGKKGKFERVRVTTEVGKLQFLTPSEVFLPPSQ